MALMFCCLLDVQSARCINESTNSFCCYHSPRSYSRVMTLPERVIQWLECIQKECEIEHLRQRKGRRSDWEKKVDFYS